MLIESGEDWRELYPFESHWMERGDLRYHYLDEGPEPNQARGETIVCVHGNPTWSFYFRRIVESFSNSHRVIVPDHIGCGLSEKPDDDRYGYTLRNRVDDLEALLDHLDVREKITLVVHDWGGMIGMSYAVRHPERIQRIVVLNTAAFAMPAGKKLPWQLTLLRKAWPLNALLVRGFNAFAGLAKSMAPRRPLSEAVASGLLAPYHSWASRIATLRFVQDIPLGPGDLAWETVQATEAGLETLSDKPMLICWGQHDFVFDVDYYAQWCERFPSAEAHLFEDAGHYVLEDEPGHIVSLMQDFMDPEDVIESDEPSEQSDEPAEPAREHIEFREDI